MKKTLQRVLSLVLCVLMALSTTAVAFAADSEEGKPTLGAQYFLSTTDSENAKFVLDMLDEQLKKMDLNAELDKNLDKDVGLGINPKKAISTLGLVIDMNSVDGLCRTLDSLKTKVLDIKDSIAFIAFRPLAKSLLGDIYNFSLKTWKTGLKRTANDAEIINNFIAALGENSKVFAKVIDKSFDLGALGYAFSLDDLLGEDGVSGLIKGWLVSLIHKDEASEEYKAAYAKAKTDFDSFLFEDLIPLLLKDKLPGLNLNKDMSVDRLFSVILECGWKDYFIEDIKSIKIKAEGEALEKLSEIMEFDGQNIDTDNLPLDSSKGLKAQLNDIHGYIICQFFPKFDGWVKGSDIKLLGKNYASFMKYASKHFFGNENAEPVDILKYILNSIAAVNTDSAVAEYAAAVANCKDLKDAIKAVLILNAKKNDIPVNEKAAGYENVLGDYIAYYANKFTDLGYGAGSGRNMWNVINDLLNVYLFDKGFAKALNLNVARSDSLFTKLDKIINVTKIWSMTGTKRQYKSEEFIKGFLDSVLNFDIEKALDLTVVRFADDFGTLNLSVLLYNISYNFLNNMFGTPVIVACNTSAPFQTGFENKSLKVPVEKMLTKLNEKKAAIVPPVLFAAALAIETLGDKKTEVNIQGVSVSEQVYTGKEIVPSCVYVTVNGKKVKIPSYQFTASLANNKEPGTASGTLALDGAVKNAAVNVRFNIVLGKVSGLKLTKSSSNSLTLAWNKVTGAKGYVVEYTAKGKKISKTVSSNTVTVTGLSAGSAYSFKVRAVSGSHSGAAAVLSATTKPARVTGLKLKERTSTSITLTWNKVTGAKKYEVQMLRNGKWVTVATTTKNSAVIGKKYIKANSSYSFRVRAVGSGGYGEYSAALKVYSGLAKVSKVKATKKTQSSVTLTWSKVSGAKRYEVWVSNGKKWVKAATVSKNTAVIKKGLKKNTAYKFKVRAYKTVSKVNIYGDYSSTVKVKTAK